MSKSSGNGPAGTGPMGIGDQDKADGVAASQSRASRGEMRGSKGGSGGGDIVRKPKPKVTKAVKVAPAASAKNLLSPEAIKKAETAEDMRQRQMRQQNQDNVTPKVNLLGDAAPITLSVSSID